MAKMVRRKTAVATRSVRRQVISAYDGVQTDISKVEALQKSVEAYKLGVEAKSIGMESGLVSVLDLLDTRRDLYITESSYIRARYSYILNTLRLKRAVGVITVQDLQQINALLGEQVINITL